MAIASSLLHNVSGWIEENKSSFTPPVCNKLMHGAGQLKVMFIGGPNVRKDYHIEEGEELFYQVKGDMVLKIIEKGQHKDVVIKEGEMFRLPSRMPHSPQRQVDTVGLVIERERYETEKDALRFYQEGTTDTLWEAWFHCTDLGTQLAPVIEDFFASEEHKTGIPPAGKIFQDPPFKLDVTTEVTAPFTLKTFLSEFKNSQDNTTCIFSTGEFRVEVVRGKGTKYGPSLTEAGKEVYTWVLEGEGRIEIKIEGGVAEELVLKRQDSLLVKEKCQYQLEGADEDFIALVITMDPLANK